MENNLVLRFGRTIEIPSTSDLNSPPDISKFHLTRYQSESRTSDMNAHYKNENRNKSINKRLKMTKQSNKVMK
jgi:hypothetical protein